MSTIGKIIRANALPPTGAREKNVIYQVAAPGAVTYTDYAIDENGDLKIHAVVDGTVPVELADNNISISTPDLKAEGITNQAEYNTNTREKLLQKLDMPNIQGNAQDYPEIIGLDNNGNAAKLPAGDLGKNIANSSLTSIAGAGLTLGEDWEIKTSGKNYTISGLSDVSNDSNFNTFIAQNTEGKIGKSTGKQVFLNTPSSLTESERTAWKTAMNGGWTTNTMSVGLISPPIINKNLNSNTWVALKGANLNLPPASFSVEIMNEAGSTVIATVPNAQVQLYQNGIDLTFYYNFYSLANGNYKIRLWNGVAYYTTSLSIQVTDNLQTIDLASLSWNVKTYNDASSSVIYGDGALARITPDAAVKPLAEGSEIIASVKSNTLFDSGKDFYLRFNVSYNDTGTTNADAFIGLITSETPNSLSNNNLINISFDSFIVHYTGMTSKFNGNLLQSGSTAALTALNVSIIRRGTYYSMIVETPSNGTKFFSFTNTTEAIALCLLGTNSQRPYQFSTAIQEAYILN